MAELQFVEISSDFGLYTPSTEGWFTEHETTFIYKEIFESDTYAACLGDLPEGAVIADVGANIGVFSLFVKSRVPTATVLAFEPVPDVLEALTRNLERHGVDDVRTSAVALGTEAGEITFTYYPGLPSNSTSYPEDKEAARAAMAARIGQEPADRLLDGVEITVATERLSDALRRQGVDRPIDLLKIDVEGAELDVLRGIDDADWPRIRRVAAEVEDVHGRLDAFRRELTDHGFDVVDSPADELPGSPNRMVHATRPSS
jgi:FkbM family methyltransferase